MTERPTAIAWIEPEQSELIAGALAEAGVELAAVGCPGRGRSAEVAERLAASALDDLRAAIASERCRVALIGTPRGLGWDSASDAAAVVESSGRGTHVLSIQPLPLSIESAVAGGWLRATSGVRPIDGVELAPMIRRTPVFAELRSVLESFGPVRSAVIRASRRRAEGGRTAAVADAVGCVLALLGEPEFVSAVQPGLAEEDGESAALLRFGDGSVAQWLASDRAGPWCWSLDLVGPGGRIAAGPGGFTWTDPDGGSADEHRRADEPDTFPGVLAAAIRKRLDPAFPPAEPVDLAAVLSVMDAAGLSSVTGQPESPGMIRRAITA